MLAQLAAQFLDMRVYSPFLDNGVDGLRNQFRAAEDVASVLDQDRNESELGRCDCEYLTADADSGLLG
jgi:hypothetical protein